MQCGSNTRGEPWQGRRRDTPFKELCSDLCVCARKHAHIYPHTHTLNNNNKKLVQNCFPNAYIHICVYKNVTHHCVHVFVNNLFHVIDFFGTFLREIFCFFNVAAYNLCKYLFKLLSNDQAFKLAPIFLHISFFSLILYIIHSSFSAIYS